MHLSTTTSSHQQRDKDWPYSTQDRAHPLTPIDTLTISNLLSSFMAYTRLFVLWRTSCTSPNAPRPITFTSWKSLALIRLDTTAFTGSSSTVGPYESLQLAGTHRHTETSQLIIQLSTIDMWTLLVMNYCHDVIGISIVMSVNIARMTLVRCVTNDGISETEA